MMSTYYRSAGVFHRKKLTLKEMCNLHEAVYDLPDGYYTEPKYHPIYKAYDDPIGEDWPGSMDEQIRRSEIMLARAQGPPDWIVGPEGNTITCEEVTVKVTSLPILEGYLTGDMRSMENGKDGGPADICHSMGIEPDQLGRDGPDPAAIHPAAQRTGASL
jgi:hypothetical protein